MNTSSKLFTILLLSTCVSRADQGPQETLQALSEQMQRLEETVSCLQQQLSTISEQLKNIQSPAKPWQAEMMHDLITQNPYAMVYMHYFDDK
jgi:hypothetical protein